MRFDLDYFGEWLQNLSTGIVGGLITGFLVSFLIILPTNPGIAPYLIGSAIVIAAILIINLFVQGYREYKKEHNNPVEDTLHEATRTKGVEQIKLELEVDKLYLTGIGLAFTVESVFIGLYGSSLLTDKIDLQFIQIAAISFLFIVLMICLWCDYKNKKKEVAAAFNR